MVKKCPNGKKICDCTPEELLEAKERNELAKEDEGLGYKQDKLKKFFDKKYANVQWKSWNPENLAKYPTVILFGSRGTGKTFALKHLLKATQERYTSVHIFSGTANLQRYDSGKEKGELVYDFVPKSNRYEGWDEKKLRQLLEVQREFVDGITKMPSHPCIIFDDIIHEPKVRSSPTLIEMFSAGRHFQWGLVVILSQVIGARSGVNNTCKQNTDAIIAFKPSRKLDRETIVEDYLSTIDENEGDYVLKTLTKERYQMIVISIRDANDKQITGANSYEDYVTVWKTENTIPMIKIGKPISYDYSFIKEKPTGFRI